MASLPFVFIVLGLCPLLSLANNDVTIKIEPGNMLKVGGSVTVSCAMRTEGVVWTRRTGSILYHFTPDTLPRRYQGSTQGNVNGVTHFIIISDLKYEDTGEIGCSEKGSPENEIKYATLAVCEDTESPACECIAEKGWQDAACFEFPPSVSNLKKSCSKTTTGLIVCIVIAVIYGIVVTVFLARDCMERAYLKQKKRLAQKTAASGAAYPHTSYDEAEQLAMDSEDAAATGPAYQGLGARNRQPNTYAAMRSPQSNPAFEGDENVPNGGYSEIGTVPTRPRGGDGTHPRGYGTRPRSDGTHPRGDGTQPRSNVYEDVRPKTGSAYAMPNASQPNRASPFANTGQTGPNQLHPSAPPTGAYEPNGNQSPGFRSNPPSTSSMPHTPQGGNQFDYNHAPASDRYAPPKYNDLSGTSPSAASTPGGAYPKKNYHDNSPREVNMDPRMAYSDNPGRNKYLNYDRAGYSQPKKLDFKGPTYEDLSQPYVDKTDTVV